MIHVARKFGAVSKNADFSSISLNQLTKSFTGTAVFTEALKETLSKDFDLENLKICVERLKKGEVQVVVMQSRKKMLSPIARVGLEKIGRRVNLIPSDKMERLILESAKVRLLNEVKTFVCVENWDYVKMMPVKDLEEGFTCPECGSNRIGILGETEEVVKRFTEKHGKNLTKREKEFESRATRTAILLAAHGSAAALALAGRSLRLSEVEELVTSVEKVDDRLVSLIVDAERKALTRRFS